jgi:uncharacterized membrane protein YphA (DoxX/SURF4 family)
MILNTFPDLLTFSILSPFILRIALGLIAVNLGRLKLTTEKTAWKELFETINFHPSEYFIKGLAGIEIIGGLSILAGTYTQISAIIFSIIFFCEMVLEFREESLEKRNLSFYILMFAISLSLVFLGAGAFAIDSAL